MDTSLFRRLFKRSPSPVPESIKAKADQGDAQAQFSLGLKYALGEGADLDYVQAARWYLKAAEQSHALAQFNLGIMYAQGQGMPLDKAQSILWIQKAADLGDPGAQHTLGVAHHRTSLGSLPEDAAELRIEAYKWLRLAGAQGYQDSAIAWGRMTLEMTNEDVADGNRRVAAFEKK